MIILCSSTSVHRNTRLVLLRPSDVQPFDRQSSVSSFAWYFLEVQSIQNARRDYGDQE